MTITPPEDQLPRIVVATRLLAALTVLVAFTPSGVAAQLAVTTTDVNLRPNHSTHDPPLRALLKGDTLALLAPDTSNGFVHVRTRGDATVGWVYNRYVVVASAPTVASPRPAPETPSSTRVTSAPSSYHGCPSVGLNNSGRTPGTSIQELNLLKNRYAAPTPSEIDHAISLEALLAPGDDRGRFDEHAAAEIVGVVTDVMVGGKETTNCEATDPKYRDSHIRIGRSADAPENARVVVEVTPRWRAAMAAAGIDWSTSTLAQTLVGKRVRVVGWMLFDAEHASESENTNPGNPRNWRATVWEIHPITVLQVLPQ